MHYKGTAYVCYLGGGGGGGCQPKVLAMATDYSATCQQG